MNIKLNHTIVHSKDKRAAADFFTGLFGTPPAKRSGPFLGVEVGNEVTLDPGQTRAGKINHHDGGRGVYFEDPSGHLLEIITRPYGSNAASGS